MLNDIIGYIFKKYSKIIFNDSCAIFGSYDNQNLNFLPNHHTEVVAFIFAFFSFDMYRKGMNWIRFSFLFFMLLITVWSRMSINCEGDFNTVIFNLIIRCYYEVLFTITLCQMFMIILKKINQY